MVLVAQNFCIIIKGKAAHCPGSALVSPLRFGMNDAPRLNAPVALPVFDNARDFRPAIHLSHCAQRGFDHEFFLLAFRRRRPRLIAAASTQECNECNKDAARRDMRPHLRLSDFLIARFRIAPIPSAGPERPRSPFPSPLYKVAESNAYRWCRSLTLARFDGKRQPEECANQQGKWQDQNGLLQAFPTV